MKDKLSKTRLPRGTKPVVQAFLRQLLDEEQKPGNSDKLVVAKAALEQISGHVSEMERRSSARLA